MKKIFSLLMVAAIVLTMSITSFAAGATMKTVVTETDTDITVKVIVDNVEKLSGATAYILTSKATLVDGSAVIGSGVSAWETFKPEQKKDGVKITLSTANTGNYVSGSNIELVTYKVAKSEDITAADFTYGTGTLNQAKIVTPDGTVNSKASAASFTVEYVDNRTPAPGPDPEVPAEDWDTTEAPKDWSLDKFTEADEVRRVVVFGKNVDGATSTATAGNYGVKFGKNTYTGAMDVTGQYWAIVIFDNVGDLINPTEEYKGTAFVGEDTWPVTVTAE